MLKQISLKNCKSLIGSFKESINERIPKKKIGDELYNQYVMNAIKEAEENLTNGGKTYTLEEYKERMKKLYGTEI